MGCGASHAVTQVITTPFCGTSLFFGRRWPAHHLLVDGRLNLVLSPRPNSLRLAHDPNSVSQEPSPAAAAADDALTATALSSSPLHPHAAAVAVSGAQPAITCTTMESPPLPELQKDEASPMHEAAAVSGSVPATVSRGITLRGLRKLSADIHRLFQEGQFSQDLQTQVLWFTLHFTLIIPSSLLRQLTSTWLDRSLLGMEVCSTHTCCPTHSIPT
jgi:hypothetical protein